MTRSAPLSRLAAVLVLSLSLATAACGSSGHAASSQASAVTAKAAGAAATSPAVLQFKAPLATGGALDGTTFTGKPVAFWFWAPW